MIGNIFVQSWLIWAAFHFCFIKSFLCEVMIWRKFLQNNLQKSRSRCSYKFPDIHKKKKQPPECSVRKGVLRNFAKFKGKHLYQNLFFNKVIINLIKKETLAQVFFCEFGRISKNTFFTEHFWATLLKKISVLKSLFDIFRGLKACNFN